MRGWLGWLVMAAALCVSFRAAAQSTEQKAAAQMLFDEGRKLSTAGKKAQACQKFQQSFDLDPAVGTQLNLARCYEDTGNLASAWIHYNEAAGTARSTGQIQRASHARQQADRLKPKLSTLTINAPHPNKVTIQHNGTTVAGATLGTAMPVDPGMHTIIVSADSKESWERVVEVGPKADAVVVDVPALRNLPPEPVAAPEPPPKEPVAPAEGSDATVEWVLGGVSLALGLGGVATGTVLRIMALNEDEKSLEQCLPSNPNQCSAEGADLRDKAKTLQLVSTIAWAGGGALTVTGIVLLIHAGVSGGDDGDSAIRWTPHVGPGEAGLTLHGAF